MRILLTLLLAVTIAHAAVPPELAAALQSFRPDPAPGWSYSQTTAAEGKSTVEHCDFAKPAFDRWSLRQKDGRQPTPAETKDYSDARSRRSRGGTAPKLTEQLDLAQIEIVSDDSIRATYRCRLKPGEPGDKVAAFLRATLIVHKPSKTIEHFELSSTGTFKPTFGVTIAEMKTVTTYSLPSGDAPSLLQKVETHVRGRAFWLKSLDADMTVTFSDYVKARAR